MKQPADSIPLPTDPGDLNAGNSHADDLRAFASMQHAGSRIVSEAEKYGYASGNHLPIILLGALSGFLLIAGLCRFAAIEAVLFVAVPFVLMNGTYLILSYGVMFLPPRFRLKEHLQLVEHWSQATGRLSQVSVDLLLPVCGERLEVIRETWKGVREIHWPGTLQVYVLDDSADDRLQALAVEFGFHYVRRADREFRKAGNLRNGFKQSAGEFILLLDADFRPSPEILFETIPDLLQDEQLAIVQSPQYFNVHRRMNWVEAGAGFVQELFFRLIQPARDRLGAAVCVGSCAVYRRQALLPLQGAPAIDHSEDLWTGFELLHRGWKIRYLPVVLAKGLCPDSLETFFNQQYRWCRGSLSLVLSREFWRSRLTVSQKFCFAAGLVYYLATAMNSLLTPLPLVVMVCLFPTAVHWNHLAFSILALIYTPFVLCWWSRYGWGIHFLTTREVSGAAHLNALLDTWSGRARDWVATGTDFKSSQRPRIRGTLGILLASSGLGGLAVWMGAVWAIQQTPYRFVHFLPPLLFSSLHMVLCWRAISGLQLENPAWLARVLSPRSRIPHSTNWTRSVSWGRTVCGLGIIISLCSITTAYAVKNRNNQQAFSHEPASLFGSLMNILPGGALSAFDHDGPMFSTDPDSAFGPYIVHRAFPGIELHQIMRLREHPHQAGAYFLADTSGRIFLVERVGSRWALTKVVDLTAADLKFLYSFEIHPDFPKDPRIFVAYHAAPSEQAVAFRVTSVTLRPGEMVDHRDEQLLIEQQVDSVEHLGADLALDDQGCLLISCGDHEQSLNDQRSQKLNQGFHSGILRIDIDQRGGDFSFPPVRKPIHGWTSGYFIPRDNPFVGQPDVLEEFWALGLRNPFRMQFDPNTRKLWMGDVGQDRLEQVEVAQAGTNHQWSYQEGSLTFEQSYLQGHPPEKLWGIPTNPIHEYPHEDLNSCVIGGVIYRGAKFPELQGRYIYGDNRSGRIWSIDPQQPRERQLLLQLPFGKASSTLVSISTDRAGEIYFTNFASTPAVYQLGRSTSMQFPRLLSETGCFSNLSTQTPADNLIPYEVIVPLWSDGMEKRRYIRLPPGTQIENRNVSWKFPPGTLFVKHFAQGADYPHPGQPVETRLLVVRHDASTAGATYVWNESGTEAVLQVDRVDLPFVAGGASFNYHIPDVHDCKVCHHPGHPVLGFRTEQLHRDVWIRGTLQSQLAHFSQQQLFEIPVHSKELSRSNRLSALDELTASLERRALSYLHANCSFCHNHNGLEHVRMDLDLFRTQAEHHVIQRPAQLHYHQIDGRHSRFLIAPGDLAASAIYQRLKTEDQRFAMPYLGRSRPDFEALQVLADWILSLSPPAMPSAD